MSDVIKLENISKSFVNGEGQSLEVLKSVGLKIQQGETLSIMGPSGCGKSTLLNIIGTLDDFDEGSLEIAEQKVTNKNVDAYADLRLSTIGFVFQKHHLMPQLTALENVLLPTLKSKNPNAEKRANELFESVGLGDRKNHHPGQLSGGECQRVALCRALINSPKVLLADEPTGALDEESANQLTELLLKLNKEENLTLVTVTHSKELANRMSTIYELKNGVLDKK
ncbi:MAG: ABC transporter ATP-binding protein [Lentisphaeraceae bacterium]|nr:ABC transporter ATP-binding protein [Lentisphaeraceae bacterium]